MKKGAKVAVFIASMALTVGSLIAVVGPRHHGYCGMHRQGFYEHGNNQCGNWNKHQGDSLTK